MLRAGIPSQVANLHPMRTPSRLVPVIGALLAFSLGWSAAGVNAAPAAAGKVKVKKNKSKDTSKIKCKDNSQDAKPLDIPVGGDLAHGAYSVPKKNPSTLVVFDHGYGHTNISWHKHMRRVARDLGVAAVTMDYRGLEVLPDDDGDGLPSSRGWNVMAGAEDSIAAAQLFDGLCKTIDNIIVFGVSMGGNTAGLVVALQGEQGLKDKNGDPLFDHWFNIEGAVNVTETYNEASLLAPANAFAAKAKADIEAEMGGTFQQVPGEYEKRTVVARMADVEASGVQSMVMIHGVDDGLVPYNQSREMAALMLGSSISTDFFTVGRRSAESERETTATGYVGSQIDKNYTSPFAGHASEKSETHIIMVTAFERLAALLEGEVPSGYNEYFVDGPTGTYP